MDFNAMDNRKCTICDFVFDQDCDDCPAMPSQIRSLHHPTKRTQGVAHKGANRMTDKTAIEKAKEAAERAKNQIENCFPVCDPEIESDPFDWAETVGVRVRSIMANLNEICEALAALEAEKPDEHDIEKLVEDICEPGSTLWSGETSDLDGEWIYIPRQ